MKTTLLLLLFIMNPVHAGFTEACFENRDIAKKAKQDIGFLLLKSDKLQLSKNCLEITAADERIQLFQKYLKRKYRVTFLDLAPSSKQNCKLELIKTSLISSDTIKIETHAKNIQGLNEKNKTSETTNLVLTEGLPGSIVYQDHSYEITCHRSTIGYNITLKSSSPDFMLDTSRFIRHGESIELGSIIKRSDSSNDSIDINSGIKTHHKKQKNHIQVYLKAKE